MAINFKKNNPIFLDLNVKLFQNKSNGQISINLPKKKIRKIMNLDPESPNPCKIPNKIPIRIFKWSNT